MFYAEKKLKGSTPLIDVDYSKQLRIDDEQKQFTKG